MNEFGEEAIWREFSGFGSLDKILDGLLCLIIDSIQTKLINDLLLGFRVLLKLLGELFEVRASFVRDS